MSESTTRGASNGVYTLQKGWRTLALAGGAVALLGVVAIAFPLATGLSVSVALGVLLVVGGVVHGVHAFSARGWSGALWQLALGVVSVFAGLALVVNPILGLATLTLLAIAYLAVEGVAELAASVRMSGEEGRLWIAASGAISLVLAALLWLGFPATAAWAIGLLVGLSLLSTGLSMALVAVAGRGLEDVTPAAPDPRRS